MRVGSKGGALLDKVDDTAEPVGRDNEDAIEEDVLNTKLPDWPNPELIGTADVVWIDEIGVCLSPL